MMARSERERQTRRGRSFESETESSIGSRIDEEIRFHIESRVDELVASGESPEAARVQAMREFGDAVAARAELARVDRAVFKRRRMLTGFRGSMRDLRQVVRSLWREPGFSAVVVVTLALATGANAAVFGIIDRLLLRGPEHIREQENVVRVYGHMTSPSQGRLTTDVFGYVTYTDLRDGASSLENVAAYSTSSVIAGSAAEARPLRAGYATWDFFPLLGVSAQRGRFFSRDEDAPPRGLDVAVLSDGLWRSAYAGDSAVIGKTIRLQDDEFTIIGVAPAGFTGAELRPVDVWLPMGVRGRTMRDDWATTRNSSWVRIIARLADGATTARASEEVAALHTQRAMAEAPEELRSGARLELLPLSRDRAGNEPPEAAVARWLVGVAIIVLLMAVANVSSLQLARGRRRDREVAVRLALGIGRARLVRQFFAESLILAIAGALFGLVVAHFGAGVIRAVLLPQVAWSAAPINPRVLTFSSLTAIVVGVSVGLVPAVAAARTGINRALATGVRAGGGPTRRYRGAILIVQPALALVLLVGAGLFVRSLTRVRDIDLGFEPDRVLLVDVYWPSTRGLPADEGERAVQFREQFARDAREHFASLPWVESASLSIGLPFHTSYGVSVRPRGSDSLPSFAGEGPNIMGVTENYFTTVGATLLRGRLFESRDGIGGEPVTIVNESMARVFWPGEDALGQCLTMYDEEIPCVRVVGVVHDAKQWTLLEAPALQYYVPIAQAHEISGPLLLIRPTGDAESSVESVRTELLRLRPDLPYASIGTIQRRVDPQVRPWQMGAILFSLFGLLALTVAASGLYSVLAHLVEQRRHEFGVRSALGASMRMILVETMRKGLLPSIVGLAIGGVLALMLGSRLEPRLYETSARDPIVFGGAAGLLLLVALLGTLIPAHRAARVDPTIALRDE